MKTQSRPTARQIAEATHIIGDDDLVSLPRHIINDLIAEARFYAKLLNDPKAARTQRALNSITRSRFDTPDADIAEAWLSGAGVPTAVELGDGTVIDFVAGCA